MRREKNAQLNEIKIRGDAQKKIEDVMVIWCVWEQGAEEDIWTEEGWGDGWMEKVA
jgi:hypothetical protein